MPTVKRTFIHNDAALMVEVGGSEYDPGQNLVSNITFSIREPFSISIEFCDVSYEDTVDKMLAGRFGNGGNSYSGIEFNSATQLYDLHSSVSGSGGDCNVSFQLPAVLFRDICGFLRDIYADPEQLM